MTKPANTRILTNASEYLAEHDTVLRPIINSAGLASITPHKNYYQALVESIISQQLSVKAANTITRHFIELFSGNVFPKPEEILQKDSEQLHSSGLSRQKVAYIQDLALKVIDSTVQFDHLDTLTNEQIVIELTKVKGVGEWTVHMFLIFCMGRLDVLPVGDLGIKNGIKKLYGFENIPTPEEIKHLADKKNWHPYESVASWYVWHSLDNKPSL
jgi:DNA-3-methyladenine glycosylase II